jgi:hypothetical protein
MAILDGFISNKNEISVLLDGALPLAFKKMFPLINNVNSCNG